MRNINNDLEITLVSNKVCLYIIIFMDIFACYVILKEKDMYILSVCVWCS